MSSNRSNSQSSGFVGGLLVGTAVGAIVGLLTAPRTGRETRRILQKSAEALPELAEDLGTSLQFQVERLSDVALNRWEETLVRLQDAVQAGIQASQEVQQLSSAVSEPEDVPQLQDLYPYPPPVEPVPPEQWPPLQAGEES